MELYYKLDLMYIIFVYMSNLLNKNKILENLTSFPRYIRN